jgi:hypothetical protein
MATRLYIPPGICLPQPTATVLDSMAKEMFTARCVHYVRDGYSDAESTPLWSNLDERTRHDWHDVSRAAYFALAVHAGAAVEPIGR